MANPLTSVFKSFSELSCLRTKIASFISTKAKKICLYQSERGAEKKKIIGA